VTRGQRWWAAVYLLTLHLALGGLAARVAGSSVVWLAVLELALAGSGVLAVRLVRRLGRSAERLRIGAHLLEEGDLTARLADRDVEPDLRRLITAVRVQGDRLRDQRVALEERAHFLDKVLAASPAGLVTVDFDGAISDVNPAAARLLERSAAELQGQPLAALGEPLGGAVAALAPGTSSMVALSARRRARLHKGQFMDRGFPRQFLLIEELTEELRQTERAAYEKVIRMMSHEVNNSMGAAGSLLESCLVYAPQIGAAERGDFENALGVVIGRIKQLAAFVDSFAAVVRLPPARKVPTALAPLLAGVAALLRADCERRRISWRLLAEPDVPPVPADAAHLEQALLNIAKNALEAIGSDGAVTVRLQRAGDAVLLAIEDTGPGLTPAARANLFSPFFSTKERGQGLGLTLVQEILIQHGCDFVLEGPPGGPTTFSIWFRA
jgi:two-component system nitrogen regulation sensor histidine kinase NtrY